MLRTLRSDYRLLMHFLPNIPMGIRLRPVAMLATVIAAIVAFALVPSVSQAQSTRLYADGEFSYSVELGKSISMDFALSTDIDVDEVQVMVRPVGLNSVSTYGYAEIDQGETLTATYELPTASPRYFPPGTEFDIRFILRNDDVAVSESPEYRIEYLDDGRQWKRIGDEQLQLIYYGISDRAMRPLFDTTHRNVERIKRALGVIDHHPLRAIIFPNNYELTRYGPTISQTATDGGFFGGYAYSRYYLTIMASPSVSILTHELTHLLHDIAMESPATVRAPAWLTEGIATYLETGTRRQLPRSYRRASGEAGVKRFREMGTVPGRREAIDVFYRQSGDFVGFLAESRGDTSIGMLLSELASGARLDDALTTVYGGNLDELENQWRASYGLPLIDVRVPAHLEPQQSIPPTIVGVPTPGRGSVNILESRATAGGGESDPVPERAVHPTSLPEIERIVPQEATAVPATATATDGYVTSPIGREFRPNTTMLLVAFLLALGFAALFFRRMRNS